MPRPFSVTLLTIGVLTLAIAGFLRAWAAIRLWDFLTSLAVSPGYQVITGLLIGLAGLLIVWGLWSGQPWTPRFTIFYLAAILVYFWLDQIFMTQSQIAQVNMPFAIGISLLILLSSAWILFRKPAGLFFNR